MIARHPQTLEARCSQLAAERGLRFWRGLEELADTEEFRRFARSEFPELREGEGVIDRRQFLVMLAASLVLTGVEGCTRQPPEQIVPRALGAEYAIHGKPQWYASAMPFEGIAQPVLVESHSGRPTKIEGNPDHPASRGATSAMTQASLWGLYDPDRARVVTRRRQIATWDAFRIALGQEVQKLLDVRGRGLHVLLEPTSSPTLHRQMEAIARRLPEARWHVYAPVSRQNESAAAQSAFGRPAQPSYHLSQANVIVCLDSDPLYQHPEAVRLAREFADGRRVRRGRTQMNRLYVAEPTPSVTGTGADHRLIANPHEIAKLARELLNALRSGGAHEVPHARWTAALADDLRQNAGASLVTIGDSQPPAVHVIGWAINELLGNIGKTVTFTTPAAALPIQAETGLAGLAGALERQEVAVLLILGGNPGYDAPGDMEFEKLIAHAGMSVRLGQYEDETSRACQWHIPECHYLEAWSDVRAADGTASIVQPLMSPLYQSKTAHEVLALLEEKAAASDLERVRETWRDRWAEEFESGWRAAVRDGLVPGTAFPVEPVTIEPAKIEEALASLDRSANRGQSGYHLLVRPDPSIWDGRFANNPWLQELPKPITKLCWGNAALLSPVTAERLGISSEQVIEISAGGRTARIPAWILPGQADDCVTLHLGFGRRQGGKFSDGIGVDVYPLLQGAAGEHPARMAEIQGLDEHVPVICTQSHFAMEGRNLVRRGAIQDFDPEPREPDSAHGGHAGGGKQGHNGGGHTISLSLYPDRPLTEPAWGMSIDLTTCLGCNACVVACQVENNVPTVGPEEVRRGREMHWIRVDRYFTGDPQRPGFVSQPIPCMHCEYAPCEPVCPVAATVHSLDGLNEMVYNRCVGTRYCSNNCPYKVRRFNYFRYADHESPTVKLMHNPNVTVRSRGVMEKCTYCVQRIRAAGIEAKKENRPIRDGEVVPACAAACPSQAIVFGNIHDRGSRIAALKEQPHDYGLLTELNTRPRTTYLAQWHNPNPRLASEHA